MSACAINIGRRQRRLRLAFGLTMLAAALAGGAWAVAAGAPPALRATLAVPFFLAGLGIFQARAQTCVALALKGTRNLDAGEEPVADAGESRQLRRQARAVLLQSLAFAVAITAAVLLV
jgi:hypothetical protein